MKKIFVILICVSTLAMGCKTGNKTQTDSLRIDIANYKIEELSYNGKEFKVRAYQGIIYVKKTVDSIFHSMNIYIPEEYFNGKSINGYTAETAPIFYPNQVGGYMPAEPASTTGTKFMPPLNGNIPMNPQELKERENTVIVALSHGYVVASAGARGRTNKNTDGKYFGKAPAGLIDLKAGVRYLKYNDDILPGDANKIISNGTSAGGAMSALLGATGDNPDYLPYLKEIGAAETSDAIFASSDYCPITNLDNADKAYEWQYNGINEYKSGRGANSGASKLSENQIRVSADLKSQFPKYLNSLKLTDEQGNSLKLDENGEGSFKEFMKKQVLISANKAINEGNDLSMHSWLSIRNHQAIQIDWNGYVKYMERQKTPPAFDALDLSSAENMEFGTETIDKQHFTEYSKEHSLVENSKLADAKVIKMLNPMNYIGTSNTKTVQYWRIRHGSKDKDTALAISAILTLKLRNNGFDVDYLLPWDKPHSGDYDLAELFEWIDGIVK
ncbi:alpha/beta hydrolase [Ancylomarina salipaludis]|uniref:Alpha/beta hydrolase n=1 Tax=Ancylomarina salipaludis TaxID=2501299 RepID=A0A4Q1JJS8_9BACT|nr:subtype B tannase [Ancylomarina salipaludis]RXQ91010.1 alpha/beta hydrolase [Ancylomarina salipaludis]